MKSNELIICEASEMADQLTALFQLIYERGTGDVIRPNDPIIGLAYNMSAKIHTFLRVEEERQDKEERLHEKRA